MTIFKFLVRLSRMFPWVYTYVQSYLLFHILHKEDHVITCSTVPFFTGDLFGRELLFRSQAVSFIGKAAVWYSVWGTSLASPLLMALYVVSHFFLFEASLIFAWPFLLPPVSPSHSGGCMTDRGKRA